VNSNETRDDDPARWLLRWLNNRGGLGFEEHGLIKAVIEGRAYVRNDRLYTDGPIPPPTPKASEPRHGAAQDFVEFDPYGGVRVDMARYLRSPAGQAQLKELGGKKANSCAHTTADPMNLSLCKKCGERMAAQSEGEV
jgi:hypothetical protein